MSLTKTLATFGTNDGTTPSISPGANCFLVFLYGFQSSDTQGLNPVTSSTATSSGSGPVWTRRAQAGNTTNFDASVVVFTAMIGATDPGSFTVTFSTGNAANVDQSGYAIFKFTGHDITTPYAGAAALDNNLVGNGPTTLDLGAIPTVADYTVALTWCDSDNDAGATFDASSSGTWTKDVDFSTDSIDQNFGGGCVGSRTGYSADNDVDWSDVNTDAGDYGSAQVGIIVKAATTPYIVNDTEDVNSGVADLVLSEPAGLTVGDLLLACLASFSNVGGVIASPGNITGFTSTVTTTANDGTSTIMGRFTRRLADGTEGPTYTSVIADGTGSSGKLLRITGVDTTAPVNNTGSSEGTGTTLTFPVVAVVGTASCLAVAMVNANGDVSGGATGWTLYDAYDGVPGSAAIYYKIVSTGESTNAATISGLTSDTWSVDVVLLASDVASGAAPPAVILPVLRSPLRLR
jgi:hypothetical protein